MTKSDAVRHFGTQAALARALDCTPASIAEWGEYPPPGRQFQLEVITGGALRAEPDCFSARRREQEARA